MRNSYCTSQQYIPEQINLQLATDDVVVVSFVTYEPSLPTSPPRVMISAGGKPEAPETAYWNLTGISHW